MTDLVKTSMTNSQKLKIALYHAKEINRLLDKAFESHLVSSKAPAELVEVRDA